MQRVDGKWSNTTKAPRAPDPMPTQPARWCPHCSTGHAGPCPKRKVYDRRAERARGTRSQRGYDSKWQRFRIAFLRVNPFCVDCKKGVPPFGFVGEVVAATEVHHVVKLADGGARLDPENCMALCRSCHSRRTARGE